MKIRIIGVVMSIVMLCAIPAEAQILRNAIKKKAKETIKKRIGEEAEEEAEKQTEKAVNKGIDKIEENIEADEDNNMKQIDGEEDNVNNANRNVNKRMNNIYQNMGVGNADIKTEKSYSFTGVIRMDTEVKKADEDKSTQSQLYNYVDDNSKTFAYKVISENDESALIIMDAANGAMIILSEKDGEKTAVVTKFDLTSDEDEYENSDEKLSISNAEADENVSFVKTGRTKKIVGYTCEEYQYEDSEEKSTIWITDEIEYDIAKAMGQAIDDVEFSENYPNGFNMETTVISKEDDSKMHSIVKEIDFDKKTTISLDGYKIMKFGYTMDE